MLKKSAKHDNETDMVTCVTIVWLWLSEDYSTESDIFDVKRIWQGQQRRDMMKCL